MPRRQTSTTKQVLPKGKDRGGAVAVVAGGALLGGLLWWFLSRRREREPDGGTTRDEYLAQIFASPDLGTLDATIAALDTIKLAFTADHAAGSLSDADYWIVNEQYLVRRYTREIQYATTLAQLDTIKVRFTSALFPEETISIGWFGFLSMAWQARYDSIA